MPFAYRKDERYHRPPPAAKTAPAARSRSRLGFEWACRPLFGFRARQVMDLAATYDITDVQGQPLGWFKKDFASSLLRSTWLIGVPALGLEGSGAERNQFVAILRRFTDLGRPVHFDFTADNGTPVLSIERAISRRRLGPAPVRERMGDRPPPVKEHPASCLHTPPPLAVTISTRRVPAGPIPR